MKKLPIGAFAPCPCGSELAYGECCGQWHVGVRQGAGAPTPEALMRSRYSAYALQGQDPAMGDYLLATWHPSTAPGEMEPNPFLRWVGLQVLHSAMSTDAGVVEFIARFKENGKAAQMHETSRFVREDGRWYYVDGVMSEAD